MRSRRRKTEKICLKKDGTKSHLFLFRRWGKKRGRKAAGITCRRKQNPPAKEKECCLQKKKLDKRKSIVYYCPCRLRKAGVSRGGAVWQLVGLITRRSGVQVPPPQLYGSVAQLARAFGSYPECHRFESYLSHAINPQDCFIQGIFLFAFYACTGDPMSWLRVSKLCRTGNVQQTKKGIVYPVYLFSNPGDTA